MIDISLPQPPMCLRVTNLFRIIQFLVKAVLAWYIMIRIYQSLFDTFQTAQWILGLVGFGIVYVIWRLHSLYIRINQYHLQWSFAVFDITATALVKTTLISIQLYLQDDSIKLANSILAGIMCIYLIVPFIIYIVTFYMYCKFKNATSKMGGPFGQAFNLMSGIMGIQTFSQQHGCFRFLVYINVFLGGALAIYSVIVTFSFMAQQSSFNNELGALVIFEPIDLVLNFIEDRIICSYAKDNVGSFMPEPPFPPFNCCACGAFPEGMATEVKMGGQFNEPLVI